MADVRNRELTEWVVAASKPKQHRIAELETFREMLRRKYGTLADSTEGIRADRQTRG